MPSSLRLRSLSFAACLAAAGGAQADYLWLSRDSAHAGSAVVRVGELDKTALPLASVVAPRAFLAEGKDLPLTAESDRAGRRRPPRHRRRQGHADPVPGALRPQ